MKVLFFMRHTHIFFYYRSIVKALDKRGHETFVLFTRREGISSIPGRTDEYFMRSAIEAAPDLKHAKFQLLDVWQPFYLPALSFVRTLLNYRRYLRAPQESAFYRDRVVGLYPNFFSICGSSRFFKRILMSRRAGRWLRKIDRAILPSSKALRIVSQYKPSVIVVSPPNIKGTYMDAEFLKVGRRRRIPTVVPVLSWDYLGTKGIISNEPDCLVVWNEKQAQDARNYHEIKRDSMVVAGASVFDEWFRYKNPSLSRSEFAEREGLNPSDHFIVYLGSSRNMAEDESWLVEQLWKVLRNSEDLFLRKLKIIVRPHPHHFGIYRRLRGLEGIVISPQQGELPDTADATQHFFDTLYYSLAAVVGVNTSGIIEAIIAGKPAVALSPEKYRKTQVETGHFRELIESDALYIAHNIDDVSGIILRLCSGEDELRERRREFVRKFIRPSGSDKEAGEITARAIENLVSQWNGIKGIREER